MNWLTNEVIFYSGIGIVGCSILAAVICFCVIKIKSVKLNSQLTMEYGEKDKK